MQAGDGKQLINVGLILLYTEGLTATCTAAFELSQPTKLELRIRTALDLTKDKEQQKRAKERKKSLLPQDSHYRYPNV